MNVTEKRSMVIKSNYSEMSNYLRLQICNVHLCHRHAMGESLFEPIPLQTDYHGLEVPLKVQSLSHSQHLAHSTFLTVPTHSQNKSVYAK